MATRKSAARTTVRRSSKSKRVMMDPPTPPATEPEPGPVEPLAQLVAEEPRFEMATPSSDPSQTPPSPMPEPDPMPEPMPGPQSAPQSYQPQSCTNCSHIPMGVNTVVSVMVALIFTLSSLVVASAMVIDAQSFQIKAFNGSVSSVAHR